ncbi:2,3-bisphosphoglycerate-independent phosphoglycerate mutase, partial [Desulfovibrio sp. 1214_IL3152]
MTPTLLLILDGWGIAPPGPGNAPFVARTPNMDALMARCPQSRLAASGREVGLPKGYMGNSEVGHLNIGAGRVVYQDMTRIDVALEDGSFAANPVLGEVQ